jgi:hypothetical protein
LEKATAARKANAAARRDGTFVDSPPRSHKKRVETEAATSAMPALDTTGPKPRASVSVTRAELARQMVAGRLVAAMLLGLPQIQVTEQEALAEVNAVGNALSAWGFDIEQVGGKVIATIGAVMTVIGIELPKFLAVAQYRQQQMAQAARPPAPDIPGGFGPAPGMPPPGAEPPAPGSTVASAAAHPSSGVNGGASQPVADMPQGHAGTGPDAPPFTH